MATLKNSVHRPILPPLPSDSAGISTFRSALFAAIAARSDNVELRNAIEATDSRLGPVHLVEPHLLPVEQELAGMHTALVDDNIATLRTQLKAWRRRRIKAAGRIIYLLHRRI